MSFSRKEKIAIGITLLIAITGYITALYTKPINFTRAGALITVIGVIFTTLDLTDRLNLIDGLLDKEFAQQNKLVRELFESRVREAFDEGKRRAKRRLRTVEGIILIVGTLIWGFGDLIVPN